jgi:predicted dehydrogenase
MSKFTLKWGILATGGIAETFARDLWVNPETRGVTDIEHVVVAAASSTSADKAQAFLKKVRAPSSARAYGSYEELVRDPNIDIIYIATPHSHHFQNAMLCLHANKPVLVEKAFTTNAAQAALLINLAREKNLFLMEAVWTRYFPLSQYVRETITSGRLGTLYRTTADLSYVMPAFPPTHRMVSPALAGGALLDLGLYALLWVFQTLYTTQPPETRQPPTVLSTLSKNAQGTDEHTTIVLTFPRGPDERPAHGIATTSFLVASSPSPAAAAASAGPSIRIQGTRGEIQILPPASRPTKTKLILSDGTVEERTWPQPGPGEGSGWRNGFGKEEEWNAEGEGHGMFWEADECAFALREGRVEGRGQGWEESLTVMKVMDEVRRQGGVRFGEEAERVEWPVEG